MSRKRHYVLVELSEDKDMAILKTRTGTRGPWRPLYTVMVPRGVVVRVEPPTMIGAGSFHIAPSLIVRRDDLESK